MAIRPRTSPFFEIAFLFTSVLWIAGAFIDGYAHIHLDSVTETFFTSWHAMFYGGMSLTGFLLIATAILNHARGYAWRYSLPREYLFALSGFALASLGGLLDMVWHLMFGIEVGIEALLSPTHLMLAFGGAIAVSGPLHAIWYREHQTEKMHAWPVVISFTLVLMTLNFMLQFLHPYAFPWASASFTENIPIAGDYIIALGVANMLIYLCGFLGFVLASLRYFKFPLGSFAFILTIDAIGMTLMADQGYYFIPTALLSGFLIDLFYKALMVPAPKAIPARLFGLGTGVVIALSYILTIAARGDVAWSIHLAAGLPVIAGIGGFLLTYLFLPPGNARPQALL